MILHENIQSRIVDAMQTGMPIQRVADLVGFSAAELGKAMQNDPVFAARVKEARAKPELALLQKMHGSVQWQAWKFLLQSLYPTRYVSSRKKPGTLKPPKLESEETRLARLNAAELATLEPIAEKMDGKPTETNDPESHCDQKSSDGEASPSVH